MKLTGTIAVLLACTATGCVEIVVVHRDAGGGGGDAGQQDGGAPDGPGVDGGGNGIVSGSPTGSWVNVTGSLAELSSECGNSGFITASPHENVVMAGIAKNGIYASSDGAETWSPRGVGAGSAAIRTRISQVIFDPDDPDTYYVAGTYAQPGLFVTKDNGTTFRSLGEAWHNDTMSVDFTDPERKTILAGTHEQSKIIWLTQDGGRSWRNIGAKFPDPNWSLYVHVVDAQTFMVGCPGSGVYRSTDAGESWTKVTTLGGGAAPLLTSDGSIYWPSANGDLGLSTDNGESWREVAPGSVLYPIAPIELPDGRIATRGYAGVLVSGDQGAHWTNVAPREPFDDPGHLYVLAYSGHEKAFFVAQWTCDVALPEEAFVRYDWDYEE
jgi:hypothetical protein